jgi:nucleoside-diphosphate-sugar epimerase
VLTRKSAQRSREWIGQGIEAAQGDVRDAVAVREALQDVDTVFHAAGAKRKAEEFTSVNVHGTRNLLEACCEAGVRRVVHVSSVGVIGWVPGKLITRRSEATKGWSCAPAIPCRMFRVAI